MNYTSSGFTKQENKLIQSILCDPRSWGVVFKQVPEFTDPREVAIEITKSPNYKIKALFPFESLYNLSVTDSRASPIKIYFSEENWNSGANSGYTNIQEYRTYVVNHEFGHALGHGHAKCPRPGGPAHIMQQQSLGTGQCYPYPWVQQPPNKKNF